MTKLRTLLVVLCLFALPGCASVASVLPAVIAAVVDAGQVVDTIDEFTKRVFAANPNPELEGKVAAAIVRCRSALNVALRTARGADAAHKAEVDAAFDEFKAAYLALLELTRPLGVRQAGDATLSASWDGGLEVPAPEALDLE